MKKKRFLIVKVILIVIISVIIGFGIYTWNNEMMMGSKLPMPLGFGVAEVLSDSMYPTFETGDVVVIVPQDKYEIGDIVAFQDGSMVVTHRIIDVNENGDFVTKGDLPSNAVDDLPLKEIYIYGKVVKKFDNVGPIIRVIKSPVVSVIILIIAALLFVLSAKKEKESENKDIDKIRSEIAALKGDSREENRSALTAEDIEAQIAQLKKEAASRNKKGK